MKLLRSLNGLQIAGLGFMLLSIIWNLTNATIGTDNVSIATAFLPIGIGMYFFGLQRAKKNGEE